MTTLTLRPNVDNSVQWSRSTGSYNYACVDESVADDGDYVFGVGSWEPSGTTTYIDKYGLPNHSTEKGEITSITVYARVRSNVISNNSLYLGINDSYASPHNLTETYTLYSDTFTGSYTWTNIDDLVVDLKGTPFNGDKIREQIYCSQFYVEVTYTTLTAPSSVSATDGTYSDKVTITWTMGAGGASQKIYRGDNTWVDPGASATSYNDTTAPAPLITNGTTDTGVSQHAPHINLSVTGESVANGSSHTYSVRNYDSSSQYEESSGDAGYRGASAITYQWQRSAADSDASYSNIGGATTDAYTDHSLSPNAATGRWYKCVLTSTNASNTPQTTAGVRGDRIGPKSNSVLIGLKFLNISKNLSKIFSSVLISLTSTIDKFLVEAKNKTREMEAVIIGLTISEISKFSETFKKILNSIIITLLGEPKAETVEKFKISFSIAVVFIRGLFESNRPQINLIELMNIASRNTTVSRAISNSIELIVSILSGLKTVYITLSNTIALTISFTRGIFESNKKLTSLEELIASELSIISEWNRILKAQIGKSVIRFGKDLYEIIVSQIGLFLTLNTYYGFNRVFSTTIGKVALFIFSSEWGRILTSVLSISLLKESLAEYFRKFATKIGLLSSEIFSKLGVSSKLSTSIGIISTIFKTKEYSRYYAAFIGLISSEISTLSTWNRTVSSSISVDLIKERLIEIFRKFSSSIGLVSSFNIYSTFVRVIKPQIGILSYGILRRITLNRDIVSNISIDVLQEKLIEFFRSFSSQIVFTTLMYSTSIVGRFLTSSIGFISTLSRFSTYGRVFVTSTISTISYIYRKMILSRFFISNIGFFVFEYRLVKYLRYIIASVSETSKLSRTSFNNRMFSASIGILQNISRLMRIFRHFYPNIGQISKLSRKIVAHRYISVSQSILLIQDRVVQYYREISTSISFVVRTLKTIGKIIRNRVVLTVSLSRFFDASGKRKITFIRPYKNIDVYVSSYTDYE